MALGGHDPSEPLELQPHPWVGGVRTTPVSMSFLELQELIWRVRDTGVT